MDTINLYIEVEVYFSFRFIISIVRTFGTFVLTSDTYIERLHWWNALKYLHNDLPMPGQSSLMTQPTLQNTCKQKNYVILYGMTSSLNHKNNSLCTISSPPKEMSSYEELDVF